MIKAAETVLKSVPASADASVGDCLGFKMNNVLVLPKDSGKRKFLPVRNESNYYAVICER
jgi:hypothetical protein